MGPLIVILVVVVLIAVVLIGMYNSLVSLRQQTMNAWAQIDVQLKRRYDLIPNLVESVKGIMNFEQETLTKVIQARNNALSASTPGEKMAADAQVTSALGGFFALSEAYPELKSNENMLALQEELKGTENKIGMARGFYNDVVTNYNTKLETFPSSLMANMGGFKPKEVFEISDAIERENVKVSF